MRSVSVYIGVFKSFTRTILMWKYKYVVLYYLINKNVSRKEKSVWCDGDEWQSLWTLRSGDNDGEGSRQTDRQVTRTIMSPGWQLVWQVQQMAWILWQYARSSDSAVSYTFSVHIWSQNLFFSFPTEDKTAAVCDEQLQQMCFAACALQNSLSVCAEGVSATAFPRGLPEFHLPFYLYCFCLLSLVWYIVTTTVRVYTSFIFTCGKYFQLHTTCSNNCLKDLLFSAYNNQLLYLQRTCCFVLIYLQHLNVQVTCLTCVLFLCLQCHFQGNKVKPLLPN